MAELRDGKRWGGEETRTQGVGAGCAAAEGGAPSSQVYACTGQRARKT